MTGFCQCGCGQPTKIAQRDHAGWQRTKGQPSRFLQGHHARMKPCVVSPYPTVVAADKKQVPIHVVVATAALGRPLPKGAVVHHVDGNGHNNVPWNLVICNDQGYHLLLHSRAVVVRAGGNPNEQQFCRGCQKPQDFSNFHARGGESVSRRQSQCKACVRARVQRREARRKGAST